VKLHIFLAAPGRIAPAATSTGLLVRQALASALPTPSES